MSTATQITTAGELFKLSNDSRRYELVKGELLTMSPTGEQHGAVTMNLSLLLGNFIKSNKLGVLYAAETGFQLETNPDTVLAPDISFIACDGVENLSEGYHVGPPDLAVEVLSPSDSQSKVQRKTTLWLELGAKAVWVVNPRRRTVEIIRRDDKRTLLHESDELVDDTVPGFRVKVSEIFG